MRITHRIDGQEVLVHLPRGLGLEALPFEGLDDGLDGIEQQGYLVLLVLLALHPLPANVPVRVVVGADALDVVAVRDGLRHVVRRAPTVLGCPASSFTEVAA